MTSPCRLGLFGGSFDPVHLGHLHAARTAREARGLDRVVFVPAARPPHKPGRRLAAGRHRLAMLRLAIAGEPSWTVSDLELSRSGPSYTIDTVRALPAAEGQPDAEVFLILGYDNLAGLPQWREVQTLLTLARPLIVWRADDWHAGEGRDDDWRDDDWHAGEGGDGEGGDGEGRDGEGRDGEGRDGEGRDGEGVHSAEGSTPELPETVTHLPPELVARIREGLLPTPAVPGSATDLRAALARGETRLPELPHKVGEYIREHGLYREEP